MPRFLDTHTGEFHWFEDPSTVSYAILSHTWRADDKEQTLAQVREMWKGSRGIREHSDAGEVHDTHDVDPFFLLPELCDKIQGICKVAREAGYRFVWIDTCCIDKTSSAELAEAINTMFMLYKLAQVCYVYLEKVPDGENPRSKTSQFRRSRWHTRGWTLQELIAPWSVVFLSETWTMLGTKMTLAATLAAITNIDLSVLTGRESLDTVSVARRMSWASSRQTKRVEDRAYSLLGIFGVQISPIYGEGMNAFIRLQEEIIRTIPDQSIFAWGRRCTLMSIDGGLNLGTAPPQYAGDVDSLLAPSPSFFGPAYGINMLTPKQYASRLNSDRDLDHLLLRDPHGDPPPPRLLAPRPNIVPPPVQSTPVPQGLRLSLVCVDLSPEAFRLLLAQDGAEACELCRPAVRLALLPCEDQRRDLVALPLLPPSYEANSMPMGLHIGTHIRCKSASCPSRAPNRTLRLGSEAWKVVRLYVLPEPVKLTMLNHRVLQRAETIVFINLWRDLYASDSLRGQRARLTPLTDIVLDTKCEPPLSLLGYTIRPLRVERLAEKINITTLLVPSVDSQYRSARSQRHRHIRICIILSYNPIRNEEDTCVSITVETYYGTGTGDSQNADFPSQQTVPVQSESSSSVEPEVDVQIPPLTTCHTHPDESSPPHTFHSHTCEGILVQDHFDIPVRRQRGSTSDTESGPDSLARERTLRISLECRRRDHPKGDAEKETNNLRKDDNNSVVDGIWFADLCLLSVELSEEHRRDGQPQRTVRFQAQGQETPERIPLESGSLWSMTTDELIESNITPLPQPPGTTGPIPFSYSRGEDPPKMTSIVPPRYDHWTVGYGSRVGHAVASSTDSSQPDISRPSSPIPSVHAEAPELAENPNFEAAYSKPHSPLPSPNRHPAYPDHVPSPWPYSPLADSRLHPDFRPGFPSSFQPPPFPPNSSYPLPSPYIMPPPFQPPVVALQLSIDRSPLLQRTSRFHVSSSPSSNLSLSLAASSHMSLGDASALLTSISGILISLALCFLLPRPLSVLFLVTALSAVVAWRILGSNRTRMTSLPSVGHSTDSPDRRAEVHVIVTDPAS